ncbi:MAG: hypothetical protein R6V85_14920 [Polyangia bacterium]
MLVSDRAVVLVLSCCCALAWSSAPGVAAAQQEAAEGAESAPEQVVTESAEPPQLPGAEQETVAVEENTETGEASQAPPEPVEYHRGFFFRMNLGLGWSWIFGRGTLSPAKGLRRIDDPEHHSPALSLALSLGGGLRSFALHLGVLVERMVLRARDPVEMGFTLLGIGGGLTYYFTEHDFFATARARLVGLMLYQPGVLCDDFFEDKYQWYGGPGVSLTLGKEWFGDDEGGVGLGIQGSWARLEKDSGTRFDYASVLVLLTVSHF